MGRKRRNEARVERRVEREEVTPGRSSETRQMAIILDADVILGGENVFQM
jgi:hypothetical protein